MQNKLDRGAKLLEEKRKEASTAKAKADQIASQLKRAEKDVSYVIKFLLLLISYC